MTNNTQLSELPKEEWDKIQHLYWNNADFDLKARTQNLMDAKKILDEVGLDFWLTKGTALAAYREKDWIPWDDDLDFAVYEEDFLPKYNELYSAFLSMGFVVRGSNKEKFSKLSLFRHKEKTQICALYLDPSYEGNRFRLRKSYKYPRHLFENKGHIEFQGESFLIPSPVEDFLVYVYGKNYRKPNKAVRRKKYSSKSIYR